MYRIALLLVLLFAAPLAADEPAVRADPLVVVAPRAFLPALAGFVAHKRKTLPVEIAVLEEVLQGPGVDDPEKLKRYLYAAWRARSLRYCLLVGDAGVLPVRYMTLDRNTAAAFDTAFYPSDLYYADLAKEDGAFDDWNARKDGWHAGYFGEVHGEHFKDPPINFDAVDYRPELAVGRWPVRTPEELGVVAGKSIAFEEALAAPAPPAWRGKAVFVAGGGWVDARPLLGRLAEELKERVAVDCLFYRDEGEKGDGPLPTEAELVQRLKTGVGFVFHAGHGVDDGWHGCLSSTDLDALADQPAPAIFFSAGCGTALFATLPPYEPYLDVAGAEHPGTNAGEVFSAPPPFPAPYQDGKFDRTGLGEKLLRNGPHGAVAYFGCNTGSQPCSLTLMEGFLQALAHDRSARLGDLWCAAVAHYWDAEHLATLTPTPDWYPASIFFQGMKFMLFGDPSLRVPVR